MYRNEIHHASVRTYFFRCFIFSLQINGLEQINNSINGIVFVVDPINIINSVFSNHITIHSNNKY